MCRPYTLPKIFLASATALNTLMLAPHVLFSLNPGSNMEKPHSQASRQSPHEARFPTTRTRNCWMNYLPSPFSSRACCSSETATDPPSEHGHGRRDMVVAIIGMGLVCSGDSRGMRYATSEDLQNMQAGMQGIKSSSCDKTSSVA